MAPVAVGGAVAPDMVDDTGMPAVKRLNSTLLFKDDAIFLQNQSADPTLCSGTISPMAGDRVTLKDNFPAFSSAELAALRYLAKQHPNLDSVAAELAHKRACQRRPPGNVHVLSDIHGSADKLNFVLANASGTIRPFVEEILKTKRGVQDRDIMRVLLFIFNPMSFFEQYRTQLSDEKVFFLEDLILATIAVIRESIKSYSVEYVCSQLPVAWSKLLQELLFSPCIDVSTSIFCEAKGTYLCAVADSIRRSNRLYKFLGTLSLLVRNFATSEIIVNGDIWDRGPRGDRVCDILQNLPNVWLTWGNHDVIWLGAGAGCEALIACVVRISLRYYALEQFEEGYGISLAPVEKLAKTVYKDDPATLFTPKKIRGHRDALTIARMEKACAMMQFKLEGQIIKRHPEWNINKDLILHTIDTSNGTCIFQDKTYDMLDRYFPTLNPDTPYDLTDDEQQCMAELRKQFMSSANLWSHMRFLINRGSSYVVRHNHLIFHGAVPVNADGSYQTLTIEGREYGGRDLLEKLNVEVIMNVREPTEYRRDLMWYLWMGPRSPFMAKECVATFQRYFLSDKESHKEPKNAYFNLIDDSAFCSKLLQDFDIDGENGLIVNGHVPVSVKAEQNPVRKSGKAVQIDGAFSEAYGDYGYTLVIEPSKQRSLLAQHHKVADAFDVMPVTREIKQFRNLSVMYQAQLVGEIELLERLLTAYESNKIPQIPPYQKQSARPYAML